MVEESFVGIYRWHAKRTLREIEQVRTASGSGEIWGLTMLERLLPEVGYVFYVAVSPSRRRHGVGGILLDDALRIFQRPPMEVVFAAVEEDNAASVRLFESRGFRAVARDEPTWKEGGLGAWGLRSRMRLVYGEILMGLRVAPTVAAARGAPGDPSAATGNPV